jgi:hypothetical protein
MMTSKPDQANIYIRIIRPLYWDGDRKNVGEVLHLPIAQARELIASNKAEATSAPAPQAKPTENIRERHESKHDRTAG